MFNSKKAGASIRTNGSELLRGLFDLRFETIVTTQMLPVIYTMAVIFAAVGVLYSIGWAFNTAWWIGVIWLLVIGPIIFIASITTVRVVLEFVLAVFRLLCLVQTMSGQVEGMSGQVDDISHDMPRMRFWRSLSRNKNETD